MGTIRIFRRKFPAAAWILIAMVIGIIVGYMIFTSFPDKKTAAQIAGYISIMSDVFLRLIKMLIGAAGVLDAGGRHRAHGRRRRRSAACSPRRWAGSSPPRWSR